MRDVQASIAAAIYRGPGNWYEMEACLRGPGLRQAEAEVRGCSASVRYSTARRAFWDRANPSAPDRLRRQARTGPGDVAVPSACTP